MPHRLLQRKLLTPPFSQTRNKSEMRAMPSIQSLFILLLLSLVTPERSTSTWSALYSRLTSSCVYMHTVYFTTTLAVYAGIDISIYWFNMPCNKTYCVTAKNMGTQIIRHLGMKHTVTKTFVIGFLSCVCLQGAQQDNGA